MMKNTTKLFVLLAAFLAAGCARRQPTIVDELLAIEEGTYEGQELDNSTIEELKASIKELEAEVARTVDAGEKLVTYYKMVAVKYMDRDLFGLASDFFKKVLELQPSNRLVAYRLGVCVAQVALAQMDAAQRQQKFEEAERHYLYALRLYPKYDEALYAISVLYIFEFDRPYDAEPYLLRLLEGESRHFEGMFLLARVYVEQGRIDDAAALYDEIIDESGDDDQVEQAAKNLRELTGGSNGF